MEIQFQCKNTRFGALYAKIKILLEEKGMTLCGYDQDTGDSVYEQAGVIFRALQEFVPAGKYEEPTAGDADELFGGSDRLVLSSEGDTGIIPPAGIYFCAALLEAQLHPVLIFGKDGMAVGVWLYKDYNMEESRISSPEFSDEAYDRGGMLLPVGCRAMADGQGFSEAVAQGCRIVSEFVFAEDIALCNADMEDDQVILLESDGTQGNMYSFEDDGTCSYFQELLRLYDSVSREDPDAAGIMSDAVRHEPWASAFFEGSGEAAVPEILDHAENFHLMQMEEKEKILSEAIDRASLLLVRSDPGRQEIIAADSVMQCFGKEENVLVVASEERLEAIRTALSDTALGRYILYADETISAESVQKQAEDRCSEKISGTGRRNDVRKRRFHEIQRKISRYERSLDQMTECGKTLGELLEQWERVKDYPSELSLPDDTVLESMTLDLVKSYANALNACRKLDSNGGVYLDFSVYTPEQKDQVLKLLCECEEPARDFLDSVCEFGDRLGRVQKKEESVKSYLEIISGYARLMESCVRLLIWKQKPDKIPSPKTGETEEQKEYETYRKAGAAMRQLNDFMDPAYLVQMDPNDLQTLKEDCEKLLKEQEKNLLIKSRDYQDTMNRFREMLEPAVHADIIWKNPDKESVKQISKGILVYLEYGYMEEDPVLTEMEQIFQDSISTVPAVFAEQKEFARILLKIRESESEDCKDLIEKTVNSVRISMTGGKPEKDILELCSDASKLTQLSDRYSDAMKRAFEGLGINYHAFQEAFSEESMMTYIMTWTRMLADDRVYEKYQKARNILVHNRLGNVVDQLEEKRLSPEVLYRSFEHEWYRVNLAIFLRKMDFDIQDYIMNRKSLNTVENQIYRESVVQIENRLLKNIQEFCSASQEQIRALQDSRTPESLFSDGPEIMKNLYPAIFMEPENAWRFLKHSEIVFSKMIVCEADAIPFYKILFPSVKAQSLIMITEKEDSGYGSVAERAAEMKFPYIVQ